MIPAATARAAPQAKVMAINAVGVYPHQSGHHLILCRGAHGPTDSGLEHQKIQPDQQYRSQGHDKNLHAGKGHRPPMKPAGSCRCGIRLVIDALRQHQAIL